MFDSSDLLREQCEQIHEFILYFCSSYKNIKHIEIYFNVHYFQCSVEMDYINLIKNGLILISAKTINR